MGPPTDCSAEPFSWGSARACTVEAAVCDRDELSRECAAERARRTPGGTTANTHLTNITVRSITGSNDTKGLPPMEFPEPTIDVASALRMMIPDEVLQVHARRQSALGLDSDAALACFRSFLAQAWEEGRWSPPAACTNPYGKPAAPLPPATPAGAVQFAGMPLTRLRAAAQAALAWVENMAPTVRRTALAEQLRSALGGK